MQKDPILVVGHRNPDNDSVVSAAVYAHLKNMTDEENLYVPCRLGPMPKESAWLFDAYEVEPPLEITSAAALIEDVRQDPERWEFADPDARPKVILVDHNETLQSVPDIADVDVVEIVDHHRIGDVQTAHPILFLNLPVGSTATVIATRFTHKNVAITKSLAALLLAAVLTDTVLLKSPTTTDLDRRTVAKLAKIVGVDPIEFGLSLFHKRTEGEDFDPAKILNADAKEFKVGDSVVYIVQYETVDKDEVMPHLDQIQAEAERVCETCGYRSVVLMITDILKEGSEIVVGGDRVLPEKALDISLDGGSVWMPGVLSRKKQVAAKVVACDA